MRVNGNATGKVKIVFLAIGNVAGDVAPAGYARVRRAARKKRFILRLGIRLRPTRREGGAASGTARLPGLAARKAHACPSPPRS